MKKIIHSVFILMLLIQHTLFAQQDLTLYNMEVIPQRMYNNPAFKPSYSKINIGLPLLSSQYLNFNNSGFKYSDLIKHTSDDSLYSDFNNMISKLSENNYLSVAYHPDILSFGFAVEKQYFSFNITEKIDFRFRYPKDFMEFLWKGNGNMSKEINLNFGINFSHYREYGFGYAREINDKLTVGGKLSYLSGMENVWTEKSDIIFYTDPLTFDYTAKSNIIINTSGIDSNSFENINVINYAFKKKKKNKGMGINLGSVYKYNNKFTFSASIIDIGFIKWKDSPTNYQSKNPGASFTYQGIDITKLNDSLTIGESLNTISDSLVKIFKIDTVRHNYTTRLSTQFYLGTNYYVTERSNAGILFYSQVFDKTIHPSVSLSYNQRVGRWLNASASYSIYNRSYNNIGLGLALNGGPIQLYVVSDNVLGVFFPQNTKNLHLHAGINLTFSRKPSDRDKDGVPDKKDACPDVPGPIKFNGCPDKDDDKIPDKDDACPDKPGLLEFNGCPDKDGDKIIDKKDSCPDAAGLIEFNGCPDKDDDKIIDKKDSCPDDSGLPEFAGCPDRDGDKIIDKHDLCPDSAGTAELFGCPDKDGDGITDKEDRCPNKPGPKENDGCPLTRLHLIDEKGNISTTVVIDEKGMFRFTHLPPDENVRLQLESYDVLIVNELNVAVGTLVRTARRGIDGYFHFDKLSSNADKLSDIQIKLKKEEALAVMDAMENLEFDFGKEAIRTTSYSGLDKLVELMKKNLNWRLKLSGHTDNVASMKYNMTLSKKRVEAVKKYLVSKGITEDKIVLKWYGPTKPIAANNTEEGKQKNRRVEFLIIQ
ncbi:MAG: DUF5723 family protein [Bacteroidota bacterium]